MEIGYKLRYHPEVFRGDLPKIDRALQKRIKTAIEDRLRTYPERYGKPLRSPLQGLWKLRVGDYRIVFMMQSREVRVLAIQHRSFIYSSDLPQRASP